MSAIEPQTALPAGERNLLLLGWQTADPHKLEDDLEKYEHMHELAELFFAKHHHESAPVPAKH
jgi:hypothetical protein